MAMKSKLLLAVFLLVSAVSFGQQDAMNNRFVQNPIMVNPAFAGAKDVMSFTLNSRLQWTGINGAPKTHNFNLHSPLQDKSGSLAAGLGFVNDNIGVTSESGIYGDFAYKLPVSESGSIRVGLRMGAKIFSNRVTDLENTQDGDPNFAGDITGQLTPLVGFGVYYQSDKIFAGLSSPDLIPTKNGESGNVIYKTKQHIFLMAGGMFDLSPDVKLKPYATLRVVPGAPVSVDVACSAFFFERVWLGAMYRYQGAFGGSIQFQISDQFLLGYAYEYGTGVISNKTTGLDASTHEILLSYDLIFNRSKVTSPRYF